MLSHAQITNTGWSNDTNRHGHVRELFQLLWRAELNKLFCQRSFQYSPKTSNHQRINVVDAVQNSSSRRKPIGSRADAVDYKKLVRR